ncbi:MAG: hypothetical protein H7A37_03280 [Chlamydiales bacterium]|nr:hypothetical protein [Chlamydiia bacterium]MCP5507309.1 hypothetical protein [Chlamydiales bacterium]
MNLIEFIGFIVAMVALVWLSTRQQIERRRREKNPELYEKQQQEKDRALKEMLRSMNLELVQDQEEEEDEEFLPPPPVSVEQKKTTVHRSVGKSYDFEAELEEHHLKTSLEKQKMTSSFDDRYKKQRQPIISEGFRIPAELSPYAIRVENETSIAEEKIKQLDSLQDMVIINEIFGPPRAFTIHDRF